LVESWNMYTVYILESLSTGKLYVGQTSNIVDRLKRHNSGRNISTRGKGLWKVLYTEEYPDRQSAWKAEQHLKRQKRGNGLRRYLEKSK